MNINVSYCSIEKDFTIFWSHSNDENNKEIEKWCDQTFGNNWFNGIEELHYIRLITKNDVTLFALKWT